MLHFKEPIAVSKKTFKTYWPAGPVKLSTCTGPQINLLAPKSFVAHVTHNIQSVA